LQLFSIKEMSQSSTKIRIGTRGSKLALAQVEEIKNLLIEKTSLTKNQIEIITITTSGDKIQDRNLADIGGKGLFIKELEDALLQNKIDIAVHSTKDVPPILDARTQIAAFTKRKDPRDYFISQKFSSFNDLPQGAVVGTSSARRKAILLRLRPDLQIVNFRGNVDTRLAKLEKGEVDATILAICGLQRLQKNPNEDNAIATNIMLPAAGQGCLTLQVLNENKVALDLAAQVNHHETRICVEAERFFLQEINATCKTPVAAYCEISPAANGLKILNFYSEIFDFDGKETFATHTETEERQEFETTDAANIAKDAAKKTRVEAKGLLEKICC